MIKNIFFIMLLVFISALGYMKFQKHTSCVDDVAYSLQEVMPLAERLAIGERFCSEWG